MVAIEIRYFGNLDAISTQVVYKMEKLQNNAYDAAIDI